MIIRVYEGKGAANKGVSVLIHELSRHVEADVAGINHIEMRNSEGWKSETSLLVFAGKSTTSFKEALGEDVQKSITRLVHEGAFNYAGICAGAAFASKMIKYRIREEDGTEKTIQNTGLSLFNGLAAGPARGITSLPFSGASQDLSLIWLRNAKDGKSYNTAYWGGPGLYSLEKDKSIEPLAYIQGQDTPMSLRFKFGKGHVTLCSHHPEINENNIGRWAEAEDMSAAEKQRLKTLASRLDGTAFKRFVEDARLPAASPEQKTAALAAVFQ